MVKTKLCLENHEANKFEGPMFPSDGHYGSVTICGLAGAVFVNGTYAVQMSSANKEDTLYYLPFSQDPDSPVNKTLTSLHMRQAVVALLVDMTAFGKPTKEDEGMLLFLGYYRFDSFTNNKLTRQELRDMFSKDSPETQQMARFMSQPHFTYTLLPLLAADDYKKI
jgi:hypothetical protein